MSPFVFVVGAERSGTTLLRTVLDGHSDLAMLYEPHVVTELDSAAVRRADGSLDVERFAKAFVEHRWFTRWEMPPEEVTARLAECRPVYFAEAVRCLYAAYAAYRGKSRYGDKSPSYVMRMIRIGELFPEARFVHIIRDGRDASRSLQEAPWGPDGFADAVRQWCEWVCAGLQAGELLGPARYFQLRYEDLVEDPEPVTSAVCDFLDLAFEPQMLESHRRSGDVLRHERPRYHDRLAEPLRADVRNWRRELSAAEIAEFDRLAGDLSGRLGYPAGDEGRQADGARREPVPEAGRREAS
jgi:hypothetical protein